MRGLDLFDDHRGMGYIRPGDRVVFYLLKACAEQMHGVFGLCDLVGAVGAFHGDKSAADTQIRQAQLAERSKARHGT